MSSKKTNKCIHIFIEKGFKFFGSWPGVTDNFRVIITLISISICLFLQFIDISHCYNDVNLLVNNANITLAMTIAYSKILLIKFHSR